MQMLFRLCKELDHYTLGTNYQSFAAFVFQDYPKYLQLGYGLLHTKAGKYCPATAGYRPTNSIFHVRIKKRCQFLCRHLKS